MRALIAWISGVALICAAAPSAAQHFEIVEFTAEPTAIAAGRSATLRWRVTGQATQVWIIRNRDMPPLANVSMSGELAVRPLQTTIYTLDVRYGAERKGQSITISVRPTKFPPTMVPPTRVPPTIGYCSIFGHVGRDRPAYRTKAYVRDPLTRSEIGATGVNRMGNYSLTIVAPGKYNVSLRGNFPSSGDYRDAIGPRPPYRRIDCLPGGRHRADFDIGGTEG